MILQFLSLIGVAFCQSITVFWFFDVIFGPLQAPPLGTSSIEFELVAGHFVGLVNAGGLRFACRCALVTSLERLHQFGSRFQPMFAAYLQCSAFAACDM